MSQSNSPIIGIDLGTTNSVVAVMRDGKVEVLLDNGQSIVPSVVGLTVDDKLIVGQAAKNQLAAFPERTIASVKRRMGENVQLSLGDRTYSPQELSAIILRRLKQIAEEQLQCSVERAVITVPAFFDENQRQATREAGLLAGLTVERIINEPTAASLVYHAGDSDQRHLIVYDLGGGTFDVSIVRVEDGVVEVLTSKGDTHLGGDDFDQLLARHVADEFATQHKIDLLEHSSSRWRLMQACERAKCELSGSISARIAEEFIATVDGQPVSLDVTIERSQYEQLISGLVERTIECVDTAIRDANLSMNQLDELILVGGSTRTPLVQRRLREEFQREPKWSVDPDLAVALGAGTQAAMQSGHSVGPVLIDVATHSLGIEALDRRGWQPKLVYSRIVHRNSPLPVRQEEQFSTVHEDQSTVDIKVYQGESNTLEHNHQIGSFTLKGLNKVKNADGVLAVRFELTLDGTLQVTAVERASGLQESITIQHALRDQDSRTMEQSHQRLAEVFAHSEGFHNRFVYSDAEELAIKDEPAGDVIDAHGVTELPAALDSNGAGEGDARMHRVDVAQPDVAQAKLASLISRATKVRTTASPTDAEDIDRLLQQINQAQSSGQVDRLSELQSELDDILFYLQ